MTSRCRSFLNVGWYVIDIDVLSMVSFIDFPFSLLFRTHDMCHEMCFMCLHNGRIDINFATTLLFWPLSMLRNNSFFWQFLFLIITCYVNAAIEIKMIEFRGGKSIPQRRKSSNNKVLNTNICFGKLTISCPSALWPFRLKFWELPSSICVHV